MQQGYYLNYYEPMWRIKPTPMHHANYNAYQGTHTAPGSHMIPGSTMAHGSMMPQGSTMTHGSTMTQGSTMVQGSSTAPESPSTIGTDYTQGYLRSQIGKRMRVTFLLGTNLIQDRTGVLEEVGISYITLRDDETSNLVMCDIYSIKFVNIFK